MKRVVLFIILFVSIELFAISCKNNNVQDNKEENEFYYYPQKNVYYDVEKKYFYYSLNGGKSWASSASASNEEPATLGGKIIIYSADNNVYKDNAAHRKLYNGRLYNIIDADTALASVAPEVAERKVPKKKTVEVQPEEEQPIKGLKKFLNKIFGKHNRKKEEQ